MSNGFLFPRVDYVTDCLTERTAKVSIMSAKSVFVFRRDRLQLPAS